MLEIKSNSNVAQAVATSINRALHELDEGTPIKKDTQTTIAGNGNAQQAITQVTTVNTSIIAAVGQACNNIRSIASEFEALDQQIVNVMHQPLIR